MPAKSWCEQVGNRGSAMWARSWVRCVRITQRKWTLDGRGGLVG